MQFCSKIQLDGVFEILRADTRRRPFGALDPHGSSSLMACLDILGDARVTRTELLGHGRAIEYASGRTPLLSSSQVLGAAIGKARRARGENVPTAGVPRPLRR